MSYIVFARKYRPDSFDEIVGQSHITSTLKNAIEHSRVAHAYIFAGPRGVGKTTTARILAKALNCEKSPAAEPCNKCVSCREIASGSSLDLMEIDGASNRGIDEIRSLRENAQFTPSHGRFRIYIIDEVHMLSGEAFNALLKTLEEPPAHVKFIFATTHAHKVPPTILSRCQRFDFRRIPALEIFRNLKSIVKREKLSVDDDAMSMIAKYADGSMRDAQVILDQIVSFTNGKASSGDVAKVLGVVDDDMLFAMSGAICNRDPKAALTMIDSAINDGKDVMQIVSGMIEHFRNLSIAKIGSQLDAMIDAGSEKIERYRAESAKFAMEKILYVIYTLANAVDLIRKTDMARIPLEAAMVKLTLEDSLIPLPDLLKRVEALERSSPAPVPRADIPRRAPEDVKSRIIVSDQEPEPAPEKDGGVPDIVQTDNIDEILADWNKVISAIKTRKMSIASYLEEGDPMRLEGKTLTIGFAKQFQFHKEVLESADNRKLIEGAIKEMLGRDLKVDLVVTGSGSAKALSGSAAGQDDASGRGGGTEEDPDPIVNEALKMFGGKLAGGANQKR